jgi:hypothetical protein
MRLVIHPLLRILSNAGHDREFCPTNYGVVLIFLSSDCCDGSHLYSNADIWTRFRRARSYH